MNTEPEAQESSIDRPSSKSAQDYANAVNAVLNVVELAVSFVPAGGAVTTAAKKAVRYAPLARKAVEQLPNVAPVAKRAANAIGEKAPVMVSAGVGKVTDTAKGLASFLGKKGHEVGESIRGIADAHAQKKAREEARQALLDGAGIRMSVEQFMENRETQMKLAGAAGDGHLAYAGCYAIATYSSAVKKDGFGLYRDIYIGKSENMGESIFADLTGMGNVDVYADVKYKQHVYVMLYPCAPDKLDTLEASLIAALDADDSYNAPR